MPERNDDAYWKANIRLVLSLLAVWFIVSFGAGILLVEVLDNIRMGGFKFGLLDGPARLDLRLHRPHLCLHQPHGQTR